MCVSHLPSWKAKLLGRTAARYSTSRTLKEIRQQYPWFFETHHKYLWGFGEHRSTKWLLPSSLLDSQAISVRRVKPTTPYGSSIGTHESAKPQQNGFGAVYFIAFRAIIVLRNLLQIQILQSQTNLIFG